LAVSNVQLTVQSVQTDKNGSMPRLRITGWWKFEGDQDVRVLGGVVHVTLGVVQFPPVAFASGEILAPLMQRGASGNFETFIWTDPEAVRRIEASKEETTVDLQLRMRYTVLGANQRFDSGHGQMSHPFTIKTRDWITILEGFGIGSRWQAAAFQNMESDLKQAFTHITTGNYPEVLVSSP